MPVGFTFPLQRSTGSVGYFDVTKDDLQIAKNNLRCLALTNWGERVMHYNHGFNLREFLFEEKRGESLKIAIADRISSQVEMWMPYISIERLNIQFAEERPEIGENG